MPDFHAGGAQTAMARLATYWAGQGREVAFVVNSVDGPVRERVPAAVKIVDLGALATRRAFPRLTSWLGKNRPRFVVSVLYHNIVATALALRLSSPGTAHIALVRNHVTAQLAQLDLVRRTLESHALRMALRATDIVGCVSTSVADDVVQFAELGPDRVRVTFNPVPVPEPRNSALADWPTTTDKVFVAVGRLEPQKDHATLLRALALARHDVPLSLVVLGDGQLRDALGALATELGIANAVHFLGFVPSPDDYISRSDGLVLTSHFEGFPNVLAEGLALGKTIVATDAPGGSGEILGHGRFGYLAPVGDVVAVAGLLVKAVRGPLDPEQLRTRARDFSTAKIASGYEALFEAGLERKTARRLSRAVWNT